MSDGALHLLALVAASAGMACLALANAAHWRRLIGSRPQTPGMRAACQAAGANLHLVSFALCATADPLSMAMLAWPMLAAAAAAATAAVLTLHALSPRPPRPGQISANPTPEPTRDR